MKVIKATELHVKRRSIALIIILGIFLIFLFALPGIVRVQTSNQTLTLGQTLNVNVTIDPQGNSIAGAQMDIIFNKSVVQVNSITEGNLFKQGGAGTFFSGGTINNSLGKVTNVYSTILGPYNVSTQGTFVIINMTIVGTTGTSDLNLSNVKVGTPEGTLVPATIINGTIYLNTAPVFSPIGGKTVNEGQTLNFTISATDVNGDTLTYSASNLPPGSSFNAASRIFSWTPNYNQSGTYPNVSFSVTDDKITVHENITITVNDVNVPPVFSSTPANGSTFNETDTVPINITAIDVDGDPLSYMINIDGTQVSNNSSYNWETNYTCSGTHVINITVGDGKSNTSQATTIYINNVYPRYDVTANGIVDIGDLTLIGQHFGETVAAPYPGYDVNMDGIVDVLDIIATAQHMGENT